MNAALAPQEHSGAGNIRQRAAPRGIDPVNDHQPSLGQDHIAGMKVAVVDAVAALVTGGWLHSRECIQGRLAQL